MAERKYEYYKATMHGFEGLSRGWRDSQATTYGYDLGFGPAVLDQLKDGCVCIDIRPLDDHQDFVKMVFRAPLPTLDAPRPFNPGDVDPIFAGAMSQGENAFGGMLAMAVTGHMSLDLVTPIEHARYWHDCGAPVGIYREATNTIEWETPNA